ncbi:hypothetical protein CEXT_815051 [Caerostris extrusa]|uniref:Uncharacterized protein n=1 Tax=Caerostris extrusa TaxID=172846 RepID=A0AAV4R1S3_CAEEX|nr:hypothetical protein CEXT_815051 [Caerostris extrusa]
MITIHITDIESNTTHSMRATAFLLHAHIVMHFANIRMPETDNFVCDSQSISKTIFSSSSFIKSFSNRDKFMDCCKRLNYFIPSLKRNRHRKCFEFKWGRQSDPSIKISERFTFKNH